MTGTSALGRVNINDPGHSHVSPEDWNQWETSRDYHLLWEYESEEDRDGAEGGDEHRRGIEDSCGGLGDHLARDEWCGGPKSRIREGDVPSVMFSLGDWHESHEPDMGE
ncbi:hypothetical protein M408DRAFT_135478 [Serendipita vermifera MAFF 305830]|uniref:Uncharacterized protein n=1 Tax=Serendipita vermifera MAFF 305830 TaxID=933852 RepID=A0A0C3AKC2_SERVB|nr:hypothetical protein M408DRAFT_135478 [Serendipita vermifera MAFF 305830]